MLIVMVIWKKTLAHRPPGDCVTDVRSTHWRHLRSITEQTRGNMESLFYVTERQKMTIIVFKSILQ